MGIGFKSSWVLFIEHVYVSIRIPMKNNEEKFFKITNNSKEQGIGKIEAEEESKENYIKETLH